MQPLVPPTMITNKNSYPESKIVQCNICPNRLYDIAYAKIAPIENAPSNYIIFYSLSM